MNGDYFPTFYKILSLLLLVGELDDCVAVHANHDNVIFSALSLHAKALGLDVLGLFVTLEGSFDGLAFDNKANLLANVVV